MVNVRVETMPERPGHARIVVTPLPAPAVPPAILIKREGYQEANLGHRGWQMREEELMPLAVEPVGDGLALVVGPQVSRYLEPAPYLLDIPSLRVDGYLHWPEDIDVFDGDLPPERRPEPEAQPDSTAQAAKPPVEPPPAKPPEKPTEKEPEKTAPGPNLVADPRVKPEVRPGRQPLNVVIGLLMLLIIAGAAVWFAFPEYRPSHKNETAEKSPPEHTPTPSTLTPPADQAGRPASGPAWPDGTDDMSPPEVVQRASSGEAILAVAQRRMQAGKYEDALVLLEQAADRGSVPAFKALARLYDPNGFEPGKPFRNPDGRTAASYYKDAVAHGDASAAEPREALRQRLQKDANDGNSLAASALKEFWP